MKNHNLFFESYAAIEDEKERLAFLRGYLFALSPKEMTKFILDNFDKGFLAYEQILSTGNKQEKLEAKASLEEQFAFLKKHPAAVAWLHDERQFFYPIQRTRTLPPRLPRRPIHLPIQPLSSFWQSLGLRHRQRANSPATRRWMRRFWRGWQTLGQKGNVERWNFWFLGELEKFKHKN